MKVIKRPRRRKPRPAPEPKAFLSVRGFDPALRDAMKEQARAEGMFVKDWLERAIARELARARQAQTAEAAAL